MREMWWGEGERGSEKGKEKKRRVVGGTICDHKISQADFTLLFICVEFGKMSVCLCV